MSKVIIRDLTVVGGSLSLDVPLPGGVLTVPLPPLLSPISARLQTAPATKRFLILE
jgi:hypothetical protein